MRQKLMKQAAELLQKLTRLSAVDRTMHADCYICGTRTHLSKLQGCHYIPRNCWKWRIEPDNVRAGCEGCNCFKGGNLELHRGKLIAELGIERVDHMESTRHEDVRFSRQELQQQIAILKEQIKEQEERLCLR